VPNLAGGQLVQTIALAFSAREPDRVGALYIQRNPDKLRAIAQQLHP
jgi:RNA polymerase sigma-70 factor, ECF subfamily